MDTCVFNQHLERLMLYSWVYDGLGVSTEIQAFALLDVSIDM